MYQFIYRIYFHPIVHTLGGLDWNGSAFSGIAIWKIELHVTRVVRKFA